MHCTFGQKRSALHSISFSELALSHVVYYEARPKTPYLHLRFSYLRSFLTPFLLLLLLLAPLVRRVPPRFSIPPTNQEVMPGGSVNLTCVAVGSPMPYVKWTKDDVDLTKEEEMPMGRNVLEVTNIRESANYTCVAISSLGLIEATAQVTVKGESCCSHSYAHKML